jgi:hypothetical protein
MDGSRGRAGIQRGVIRKMKINRGNGRGKRVTRKWVQVLLRV